MKLLVKKSTGYFINQNIISAVPSLLEGNLSNETFGRPPKKSDDDQFLKAVQILDSRSVH